MSTDLETQLALYGQQLREQADEAARNRSPRTAQSGDFTVTILDDARHPEPRSDDRRLGRVLLVAAVVVMLLAGAGMTFAVADREPTTPVGFATEVPVIDSDPPSLADRLGTVDFELTILPGRPVTEAERTSITRYFGDIAAPPGNARVVDSAVTAELDNGWVWVEADMSDGTRCASQGPSDRTSIDFAGGMSCWAGNPPETSGLVSYGCSSTQNFGFWTRGGGDDFQLEYNLNPGDPAAVLTLVDGRSVLVRAHEDTIRYGGPAATNVEIFRADGSTEVIDTLDCG